VSYVQKGERRQRLVEKCDLVKTHTARRSGATNMYLAGVPTIAIMKITGHKTEREFMKYIRITEEQTAIELMSHPYFSGRRSAASCGVRQPRRAVGDGVTCKK
jgi:integrase